MFLQESSRYVYNDILVFDEFPDNSYFKKHYGKLINNDFDIAIFLIRDEEEVDARYQANTKGGLTEIFCNCLKWESP